MERIAIQIKNLSNAIDGAVDMFCPYCARDGTNGYSDDDSFKKHLDPAKVRAFPYVSYRAKILVIFTCGIHVTDHKEEIWTIGSEVEVYKRCIKSLMHSFWDLKRFSNSWPYRRVLKVGLMEPHIVLEFVYDLGWVQWPEPS